MTDLDTVTGIVMRVGVILSIVLVAIGVVITIIEHGANGYTVNQLFSRVSVVNSSTASLSFIASGFTDFSGLSFIYIGLIVLISIPVIRTGLALAYFLYDKNRLYILLSAIVLFNLLIAILVLPRILR
jgi:uncharacterized membrane protein